MRHERDRQGSGCRLLDRPNVGCMVYARDHKNMVEQSITHDTFKALKDDLKGYFDAEWNGAMKVWNIGRRVKDQVW
jgi:hypothetical protein